MKLKNLSLLLALVMILSSLSVTVFAATEDNIIVSSLGALNKPVGVEYKTEYDEILMKNVHTYSSEAYCTGQKNWNSAGSEPCYYLLEEAPNSLADQTHKYMQIKFNVYIENETDGVAFRAERTDEGGNINEATYYYVGIGGSKFAGGTATTIYRIVNKGLSVGRWHNVTIQIGVNGVDNTVKFYVDGVLNTNITASSALDCDDGIVTLPKDTYGWAGNSKARCVMIPKGILDEPFKIKISDFEIKETDYVATNKCIYTFGDSVFVSRSKIAATEVSAPHFGDDNQKATLHQLATGITNASSSAGSESSYTIVDKDNLGSIGGIDWSEYRNLRVKFNIFIGNDTNSLYLRLLRAADGKTYPTGDKTYQYTFSIGSSNLKKPSGGTAVTCKGLSVGKWHNVVMELGANADNNYIRYYIDGIPATSSQTTFADADKAFGFGGYNTSIAVMSMINANSQPLELYLRDFTLTACVDEYANETEIIPTVTAKEDELVLVKNNAVHGPATLEKSSLDNTNADVINVDSEKNFIFTYNNTSKRIKYYDFVKGGLLFEDKSLDYSDYWNRLTAKANAYNFEEEETTFAMVIAMYKNDNKGVPTLVDIKRFNETVASLSKIEINKQKATEVTNGDGSKTSIDFDYAKVFFWDDLTDSRKPNGAALETRKE